jgi:hypothetical protein
MIDRMPVYYTRILAPDHIREPLDPGVPEFPNSRLGACHSNASNPSTPGQRAH